MLDVLKIAGVTLLFLFWYILGKKVAKSETQEEVLNDVKKDKEITNAVHALSDNELNDKLSKW